MGKNAQGGYYFLSLATRRKLSRQQWDVLPMPNGLIARVKNMAQAEQQPLLGYGAPLFEWTPRVTIVDHAEAPILQDNNEPVEVIKDDVEGAHDEPHDIEGAHDEPLSDNELKPEEDYEDDNVTEANIQTVDDSIEDHRSKHSSGSDKNDHGDDKREGAFGEEQTTTDKFPDKFEEERPGEEGSPGNVPEENDNGTGMATQIRHNL
jgi:hypothetical protein